jgi:TonB-dependent SusC/RagA subfamily outer membrane receptor
MRHISTLFFCLLLLLSTAYAQDSSNLKIQGLKILGRKQLPLTASNTEPVIIRIRCGASNLNTEPLIIIDGVLAEKFGLKNIDPNDIENITILKGPEATTLFGSPGLSGVIVITTKNKRTIIVKDEVTGEPIPAATIDLVYGKHLKRLLSDSLGRVIINDIKSGTNYELQVSNIGYKTYKALMNASTLKAGYSVSLRRNYADLREIVVTSERCITCRNMTYADEKIIACGNLGVKVISDESKIVTRVENGIKLYPNPVLRSQQVNIEFGNTRAQKIMLNLFSLDGKWLK